MTHELTLSDDEAGGVSPCDKGLYLSVSSDGEGGPPTVMAECDGPGTCGFYKEWPLPFGVTGHSLEQLRDAHDLGMWHLADALDVT